MPGLPSQQKSTLAYSLARAPTSQSDLLAGGKWSPPVESKRARRGAKQHHRRKSMGTPTDTGLRKAATFSAGTSTAPSAEGSPGLTFMNFTMDNKDTIIKGVAPSGSGKTKQRRDREAAAKTRRLSEAVDAVIRGDTDRLAEVHHLLH
jgi:hypothetical protein